MAEEAVVKQERPTLNWDHFVKEKLVNFAETYGLEKLRVDNGLGSKGYIRRDKNNNWVVSVTNEETVD